MAKDRRQGRPDTRPDEELEERRKSDRRKGPRIPVSIWVEETKGEDLYFHRAGNLSIGGVFFERTIPHPIGTQVRLKFELPGDKGVIETLGEVVSTPTDPSGLGAGIKFLELDAVEERLIKEYIDQQVQDEPEEEEEEEEKE
jgi:hypothetical protein